MSIKFVKSTTAKKLSAKEAKLVAGELIKIQKEVSVITPKTVVDRASDPKHPLHRYFEWDNTVAAEKFREWQARHLILSVQIVDTESENAQPVRAFVNVRPEEEDDFVAGQGYVYTPSLKGRPTYQNQVLLYAKHQLLNWRKKFGGFKEFFGVVKEIDRLK